MSSPTPTPNPWLPQAAYAVPRHPAPVDLRLDGNEGLYYLAARDVFDTRMQEEFRHQQHYQKRILLALFLF